MSPFPEGLAENLRFLLLEARNQLERARDFLDSPSEEVGAAIAEREPYINNLRRAIQRKVFAPTRGASDARSARALRAAELVAGALEQLADECLRLVHQVGYLENDEVLFLVEFRPYFDPLLDALDRLGGAMFQLDPRAAVRVCRVEGRLDELFARDLAQAIEDLEAGEHAQTQLTLVFLFRSLEQMGDQLLRAGEAVLSACLGESIKVDRLWAIEDALGEERGLSELRVRELAETRSGATIRSVRQSGGPEAVIVKDGAVDKLEREREGVQRWRAIDPELAPAVREFQRVGDQGALVTEFLPGVTFETLLLEGDELDVRLGLDRLSETLHSLWRATRVEVPVPSKFMAQLAQRLPEVYAVHPSFRGRPQRLGALEIPDFGALLTRAGSREGALGAPFQVLIHGDLNLDNVLYHRDADRVHFLDLHRTGLGDYTQDAAVFLVSPLRLRVFSDRRRQLALASRRFLGACREFASEEQDVTFEARLAYGLARSFASSARFLFAPALARDLFQRSRYLLERLARSEPDGFRLPEEILRD